MKKIYNNPELMILMMQANDVLTTSGVQVEDPRNASERPENAFNGYDIVLP